MKTYVVIYTKPRDLLPHRTAFFSSSSTSIVEVRARAQAEIESRIPGAKIVRVYDRSRR